MTVMTTKTGYRPDIQGLRAIAVVMVVLFHARLPLPGGFLGVDVFFVISGFVITSMVYREQLRAGTFRLSAFYLRRFKRLTPALAFLVGVVILVSALVLSPLGQQQTAAATGIGALFLVANVVIDRTTGDYFAAPAETNPLLNTWTLSVEEQFYLVFPAMLLLGWLIARKFRRAQHAPAVLVAILASVSLLLALTGPNAFQNTFVRSLMGFYSPLTRAWEFAAGALLAFATISAHKGLPRLKSVSGFLGIAGLGVSLLLIPEGARMPGPWTLLPVASTLLVIWAGTEESSPVSRMLSRRPFTAIGDVSYSLYLWHWPLIVFAVLLWPQTPYVAVLAAAVSIIPSILSYRLLENPIRRAVWPRSKTIRVLAFGVVLPALLICLGVSAVARTYWLPRMDDGQVPAVFAGDVTDAARSAYVRDNYYPCTIAQLPDEHQSDISCVQTQPDRSVDLAILGDSHALHLFTGLAQALPSANIMMVYLHYWPTRVTDNALATFKQVAERSSIKAVVVTAYWGNQQTAADAVPFINTLRAGGKQVFITDDVPSFPFDAIACKYRTGFLVGSTQCSFDASDDYRAYSELPEIVQSIMTSDPAVVLIPTARQFCEEDECSMVHEGRLMYEDNNHLNLDGSRFAAQAFLGDSHFRRLFLEAD